MSFFKTMWKVNSRHEKLPEELALQNSKEMEQEVTTSVLANENDIVTFKIKYIGRTVVEKLRGENVSSEAVKNIIKTAKSIKSKRLQVVNLNISIHGITVTDLQGNDILKISIYRISNCSTDSAHRQIFSFISTDDNETAECHAFLCSKRKEAQSVTLAVANAFSSAYQIWRQHPFTNEDSKTRIFAKENEINNINQINLNSKSKPDTVKEEKLIDFDSEPLTEEKLFEDSWTPCPKIKQDWVSFDDDFYTNSSNR